MNAIESLSAKLTETFTPAAVVKTPKAPKGKTANKPGNPVPLAGRSVEQNGIKSPQREGSIAQCWALFDEYPETTSLHLPDYCEALDMNLGNMLTASHPIESGWTASGKDHGHVSKAAITVYAIHTH